jgi:2-methylisocitrate lyase-like PEP mutase family enzyme
MPFSDYLFVISRIVSSVQIPLSVDMEMGYGKSDEEIYENIRKLIRLGVVGINIEDSILHGQARILKDANEFAGTVEFIKNKLETEQHKLFINIRCDTFILNVDNKLSQTIERLNIYDSTGADGIFLPCISAEDDIAAVVNKTKLPLNVMCIPGLPDFKTLNKLGVKRVSMGPFLFSKSYNEAGRLTETIITENSFSAILS